VPIVLDRLRQEGAVVTTSESLAFQLVKSASNVKFKEFSKFVKEQKAPTNKAGEALLMGIPRL
jgi:hypothetical protein